MSHNAPKVEPTMFVLRCGVCGNAHGGSCEECENSPPDKAPGFRCECGGVWAEGSPEYHLRECPS